MPVVNRQTTAEKNVRSEKMVEKTEDYELIRGKEVFVRCKKNFHNLHSTIEKTKSLFSHGQNPIPVVVTTLLAGDL